MGVDQRVGGVVADEAEVAHVVGDPLELGQQRPEPMGAGRGFGAGRGLDRAGEGQREGHRAVARHAAGEARGPGEVGTLEQALDPLVDVAQPLLETGDRLAVGGEAEMAGLDDAGMDRAHRDLVQAVALDRQERIGCLGGGAAGGPQPMVEPGPRIRAALGVEAPQVADRPLQAQGRRMDGTQAGIAPAMGDDGGHRHGLDLGLVGHGQDAGVDGEQAEQLEAAIGEAGGEVQPQLGRHLEAGPGAMAGSRADRPRSSRRWRRTLIPAGPPHARTSAPAVRAGRRRPPARGPGAGTAARRSP